MLVQLLVNCPDANGCGLNWCAWIQNYEPARDIHREGVWLTFDANKAKSFTPDQIAKMKGFIDTHKASIIDEPTDIEL